VLCSDCEKIFNKNGEDGILRNIPRNYGKGFPILDALKGAIPLADSGIRAYAGATLVLTRKAKTIGMCPDARARNTILGVLNYVG
jgi:hypothetical protein